MSGLHVNWKDLYHNLMKGEHVDNSFSIIQNILNVQNRNPFFTDPKVFENYILQKHQTVLSEFSDYVSTRNNGGQRVMFPTRGAALHYLLQIAPTKLVDGSWLSGVSEGSPVDKILRRIYLEERGLSKDCLDHVEVYARLLSENYPEVHFETVHTWMRHPFLNDECLFKTGCIQLLLAKHTDKLLPEIVGYTLSYEQLPLHLLVTAYELKEHGIDPLYFNLHITVDNIASGHARQSIDAMFALLSKSENPELIFQRVLSGYYAAESGKSAFDMCSEFNVKNVVDSIFNDKASVSHSIHDTINMGNCTLGSLMKSGARLTDVMLENGYMSGTDFKDTKLYSICKSDGIMSGVFDSVDMLMFNEWFSTTSSGSEKDAICKLFKRGINRHRKVMVVHPRTGTEVSLHDLFVEDSELFYTVVSNMKYEIYKSVNSGSMKNLCANDKKVILHWAE